MRNRLSKVMAVVLSFLMIATTFSYAAGSDQFSDVQSGSWYVPYVDFVVDNGYMNGTSATTFEPNGNLTRAMFATILARYDGATVDNSKETAFSDVPVNQWYTGSIGWANEKSIVNGTGNGKFSPNNNITRQDLCVMVERYITYVETTTTKRHVVRDVAITFTDEADIDSYAKSSVDKAVIHGLVNGYPDGSFKPKQFITRAECAAIISRIEWVEGDGKDSHTITVYDEKGKATKVEVPTGETYTIPEGPTKANATFKGWNTQKDGKGTTYNPGEKILLTEDMTLYPIYEEEPIVDPGGGGGGGGDVPPVEQIKFNVFQLDLQGNETPGKTDVALTGNKIPGYQTVGAANAEVPYYLKDNSGNFVTNPDGTYKNFNGVTLTDTEKEYLKNNGLFLGFQNAGDNQPKDVPLYQRDNKGDVEDEPFANLNVKPNDEGKYLIPALTDEEKPYVKGYTGINTYADMGEEAPLLQPGDEIPEKDLGDNGGLIIEYYTYTVKADLTIAGKGTATLQKVYTIKCKDDDKSLDEIATDMISGDNKNFLINCFEMGLEKIDNNVGTKTIPLGGDEYTITVTEDRVISALKNGAEVDLSAEMAEEKAFYKERMEKVRTKAGIELSSEWTAFVEAICPANIFEEDGKTLILKNEDDLYAVVETAVDAAIALHGVLPDETGILQILMDSRQAGEDLGILFNNYTLAEQTGIGSPADVEDDTLAEIAGILTEDGGVLVNLMEDRTTYTAFEGTESIADEDDAVQKIKDRTSRDYSNNYKIRAILKAVEKAYTGKYDFKVTVTKN